MGQRPAGDTKRVREGQRVGIARPRQGAQRGLVHQGADRKMREEKAPGFLPHELGRLAPEDPLSTPEMRLEYVERGLHLPALMVQGGEFLGGHPAGLQDRRD